MADQAMPNVAGKGPAFMREMLATFKELDGSLGKVSAEAAEKIKAVCSEKGAEAEPLLTRAYMKTVKAGESAWHCSQFALELKDAVAAGNEAAAMEALGKLGTELDEIINKTKNFVVRMT